MKKIIPSLLLAVLLFSSLQNVQAVGNNWEDNSKIPADYVENGYYDMTSEECSEAGGITTLDGNGIDVCILDDENEYNTYYEDISSNFDGFNDTNNYDWSNSVQYLGNENIVQGYEDGSYKPDQEINRAELTKIVLESFFDPEYFTNTASNCFSDVKKTDWFAKYICLAKSENIVNGYPDGTFKPGNTVNQAEALKIILNAAFAEPVPESGTEWYDQFLNEAEYTGMMYFDRESAAAHPVTRGEMAYFISWILSDGETDQISFETFDSEYAISDEDFGFETMRAEDCYEDEVYDAQDKMCYLVENDQDFFGEEEDFIDYLPDEDYFDNFANNKAAYDQYEGFEGDELPSGTKYQVSKDAITFISGKESASYQNIWNHFTKLIPANYRNKITQILFFSSDDGTAAFVTPLDESDLSKWVMAINMNDSSIGADGSISNWKEFNHTLVHEFAHVMTLNDAQVQAGEDNSGCQPQFFTGEGCSLKNAFINIFVKKFWKKDAIAVARDNPDGAFGSKLYKKNPTHFVTEYASTNPGEDIADTFATFIYSKKPIDSSTIKNQKLLFFYEFPSLVTLRNQIRSNLK